MKINVFYWIKFDSLTSLYLFIISTRFIFIIGDTTKPVIPTLDRQICTKIQSMLSFGKYQTNQMSSNITYVSRIYAQNFLVYSSFDDILIFLEPKHQLHVYNPQTIHLIVNITTTNIVYATSCISLTHDNINDLFFIYETRLDTNLISIRVCQVYFNRIKLNFEERKCIETLIIQCDKFDIRINGLSIKRDHMETKKSLLFLSTNIGLIYTIFNTTTGLLIREPSILNDTLNEGSIVVTSTGIIYYANKQEHTIHEIHITKDFRIRYGKIIKSNAIKSPFGLITDECGHLYIATKSMILIMFIEKYLTVRSVFSKASDLPITIERLNATTYVYATVKTYAVKTTPIWMFNFLSFNEPEKFVTTTRIPIVNTQEKLNFNHNQIHTTNMQKVLSTTMHTTINLSERLTSENNFITEHITNSIDSTESVILNDRYSQFSISTTHKSDKEELTFPSSLSTSTSLEATPITSQFDVISSTSTLLFDINNEHDLDPSRLTTSKSFNNDDLTTNAIQTSTSSMINIVYMKEETENEINQKSFSPILIDVDVTSTLHPSSSFELPITNLISSPSPQLPLSHHPLVVQSSTTSTKLNQLLSSKYFSEQFTTASTPPTTWSSYISTIQTTDSVTTLNIAEESSSSLLTSSPDDTSSITYTTSPELTSTDYETLFTTTDSTTTFDSTSTSQADEPSTAFFETTDNNQDLTTTDSIPFQTTSTSLTIDELSSEYTPTQTSSEIPSTEISSEITSTQTSSEIPSTETSSEITSTQTSSEIPSTEISSEMTSTLFPDKYTSKIEYSTLVVTDSKPWSHRPPQIRTSKSRTKSTTTSTITTKTTTDSYRTHKQKVTRPKPSLSTTTTTTTTTTASTTVVETTEFYHQLLTSSPISIWQSRLNSLQQQQGLLVIKPSLNADSSNTLLSNELLQSLLTNTTNSSNAKLIYINLADLPPSSWNVSLQTNTSVVLDIVLPPPSHPLNSNTVTNLTIRNVEADRFSTSIFGLPINLQVDQVQTKQFSLAMDLTNDQINKSTSDVIIGHIKSEQFELNITKSDNMNLHVQQVDSDTAELFFNSQFCTNESNLQINLNLSKNGTLRYGNRAPLHIGPVFTRVHMLKQSCELEQPFTLFFDICQGENPCLNGGTCQPLMPDYNSPSYSQKDSSQINYQCMCSIHMSGDHCQHSQYPSGYCINGGTLFSIFTLNNQTIETCLCMPGFEGQHCEDNINDCINIYCSNRGICEDGLQTYSCSCYDGFYGTQCEQRNVETMVLQTASKSFATVAILLIASIAGLVVASDIHTYLTREKPKPSYRLNKKISHATSDIFENSILLLSFSDNSIEMNDLSTTDISKKTETTIKRLPKKTKNQVRYKQLKQKQYRKPPPPSNRSILSNSSYETIL